MNSLRSKTFACVLTFLAFTSNIRVCVPVQITSEKTPETMSGDFENFLNDLGSMVYKYEKVPRVRSDRQRRDEYSYTTSSALPTPTRNENIFKTQKAALRDVLMMKLVSYYERKYKITDQVSTTTDMSVQHKNTKNDADDFINMLKQAQHAENNRRSNIKSKEDEVYDDEVIVM